MGGSGGSSVVCGRSTGDVSLGRRGRGGHWLVARRVPCGGHALDYGGNDRRCGDGGTGGAGGNGGDGAAGATGVLGLNSGTGNGGSGGTGSTGGIFSEQNSGIAAVGGQPHRAPMPADVYVANSGSGTVSVMPQ